MKPCRANLGVSEIDRGYQHGPKDARKVSNSMDLKGPCSQGLQYMQNTRPHSSLHIYIYVRVHIYIYIYVYVYICKFLNVPPLVCIIYVVFCIVLLVYVHIYIYISIHIHVYAAPIICTIWMHTSISTSTYLLQYASEALSPRVGCTSSAASIPKTLSARAGPPESRERPRALGLSSSLPDHVNVRDRDRAS